MPTELTYVYCLKCGDEVRWYCPVCEESFCPKHAKEHNGKVVCPMEKKEKFAKGEKA